MTTIRLEEPLRCAACTAQGNSASLKFFETEDLLRGHIALQHVLWIPFECVICPMTMLPTETLLKQHYNLVHPKDVPKAIYTYEEEKKLELQRILGLSQMVGVEKLQTPQLSECEIQNESLQSPLPVARSERPSFHRNTLEVEQVVQNSMVSFDSEIQSRPDSGDNSTVRAPSQIHLEVKNEEQPENETMQPSYEQKSNEDMTCATNVKPATPFRRKSIIKTNTSATNISAKCRLCHETLVSDKPEARKQHIWRRHMPRAPVQCRLCSWKQYKPDGRQQLNHMHSAHPEAKGTPLGQTFKDYRQRLLTRFNRKFGKAFIVSRTSAGRTIAIKKSESAKQQMNVRKDPKQPGPGRKVIPRRTKIKNCSSCKTSECHHKPADNFGGKLEQIQPSNASDEQVTKTGKECNLCQQRVSENKRLCHIRTYHMTEKRYVCYYCQFTALCKITVTGHIQKDHPGSADSWIDNREKINEDCKLLMDRAFGVIENEVSFNEQTSSDKNERNETEIVVEHSEKKLIGSSGSTDTSECKLCSMAVQNRSLHIWVCHLPQKRYRCTLCPYGTSVLSEMKEHAVTEHSKKNDICWEDHTQEMMPYHRIANRDAFGTAEHSKSDVKGGETNSNSSGRKRPTFFCNLCKRQISNKYDHLWLFHMSSRRFVCTACSYTTLKPSDSKNHAKKVHSFNDFTRCMTDQRSVLENEYTAALQEAFGVHK